MGSCAHKVITIYTLRLKNGSQGDHYLYNEVEKSHKAEKVTKKKINNYNHEEKSCKVSKRSVQNCMSCAHMTPRVNVDGRMDRQTNV